MTNPDGTNPDQFAMGSVVGPLGAGFLTPLAAIYDSYQSSKTARENTDKTIAANKAEAELAYQRQVEMWHMQNAYNSPAEQMKRFGAAGLNPHLIYGQGSSGNASSAPAYHPADMQHRYQAAPYGAAVSSMLPTLMAVGSWMQNMRMSEVQIQNRQTDTEKMQQVIDQLTQMNPKLLQSAENRLSLFPYQKSIQQDAMIKSSTEMASMQQKFRQEYGEDLFRALPFGARSPQGEVGGLARLKFIQEEAATRLKQAQASWSEFDITNPQQIMMMVLQGVMGMAGAQMRLSPRLSTHRSPNKPSGKPRTKYNGSEFWRNLGKRD